MPGPTGTKKASKSKSAFYDTDYLNEDSELFDPNTIRAADKRGRSAVSKKKEQRNGTDDIYAEEVTRGLSASPDDQQAIHGQIAHTLSRENARGDILDVLSEPTQPLNLNPSHTDAWARNVPFGVSPPGNSRSGESPPVQTGEWARGGFNTKTPPRSPAQRKARPVSYGSSIPPLPARHQPEHGYMRPVSNYGSPPALPHLPQQHFFAAQDIDLGLGHQQTRDEPRRTFMAFRKLPSIASRPASAGHTCVFLGSNGRLDVLASSVDGRYEPVGALYNLAGGVIDATPLTWESGEDPFATRRPLVAMVIHGLAIAQDREASDNESIATGQPNPHFNQSSQYETRVEVFSLKEQTHLATLLTVPSTTFSSLAHGNITSEAAGDLHLDAFGNHLVISSGISGEVFVCGIQHLSKEPKIECLTKYWTNVQDQDQRRDSSHSRSPRTTINDAGQDNNTHQSAILSGNGRWLAICPPGPSHRPTLSAQATYGKRSKTSASIESRSPPARPPTSCAVESPDVETLLGTIARGAAQQVVKGASWLGNQGLQTWNAYWNKDQQQQPPLSLPPNPTYMYPTRQYPQQGMFPPTHAAEPVSRQPDVVTIIDMKTLSTIATFQPPKGCSFLSFMPDGLGILTASKNGDVQYVWDLMQVKHVRSIITISDDTATETESAIPRVRQIAKFERMTPSTIVDVIWEPSLGERFALVTKKGTVHLFDVPQIAFRWPPPRRAGKIRPATAPSNAVSPGEPDVTPMSSFLESALSIASKAPPMLAGLRGRAPSIGQGIAGVGATSVGIASATGVRGGRAVAAGLSKSLGAATGTVQNLRHAGETRLHVDSLASNPVPGMIAFGRRGQKSIISILDKRTNKSYYISKVQTRDKNNRLQMTSVFAKKAISFKLPPIPTFVANGSTQQPQIELPPQEQETQVPSGFWPTEPRRTSTVIPRLSHPLSHAEIDSNAPYQPFHSDPRVNLFVHSDVPTLVATESQVPTSSTTMIPQPASLVRASATNRWVFGEPISTLRLNIRSSPPVPDDSVPSVICRDTSATIMLEKGEIPEQIVSTTRRKRKKSPGKSAMLSDGECTNLEGQGGFFEDDMDVLDFAEDQV